MSGAGRVTTVGQQLRAWRLARGLSQLELAADAGTTARHLSFIETGRSRPGSDVLARLVQVLAIPALVAPQLHRAGDLPARETPGEDDPSDATVDEVLRAHEPYPACAVDGCGSVTAANRAYLALIPDALEVTAAESVERFFGEEGRRWIVNWSAVAWREADRRLATAHSEADQDAIRLALRAHALLRDVPRPGRAGADDAVTELRLGDGTTICLRTIVLRPDQPTGGPQRWIELTVPADPGSGVRLRRVAGSPAPG